MVVLYGLSGITASVTVDGRPLREHQDPEISDDARSAIRYIEAVDGQSFEVHMFTHADCVFLGDAICFETYVDGKWAMTPIVIAKEVTQPGKDTDIVGCLEANNIIRRFRFNLLQRSEYLHDGERPDFKDLGTIKIVAHHHRLSGQMDYVATDLPEAMHAVGTLPTTSYPDKTHSVGFSEAEVCEWSQYYDSSFVDPHERPAATYEFRYRSQEALRALNVLPPTRMPLPQPSFRAGQQRAGLRRANGEPSADRELALQTTRVPYPLPPRPRDAVAADEHLPSPIRPKKEMATEEEHQPPLRTDEEREPSVQYVKRVARKVTTIELDDEGRVVRETTEHNLPSVVEIDD